MARTEHGARARTIAGRDVQPASTCPTALAGNDRRGVCRTSRTATFNYDTIEFAYNKRVSQKFFVQTSVDYQWRNDFRSSLASNGYDIDLAAQRRPDRDQLLRGRRTRRCRTRQETTAYHLQFMGRYDVPVRDRLLGQLPLPERLPVLTRSSRTAAV